MSVAIKGGMKFLGLPMVRKFLDGGRKTMVTQNSLRRRPEFLKNDTERTVTGYIAPLEASNR